jgi:putative redox protein
VGEVLAAWATRYLEGDELSEDEQPRAVVVETTDRKLQQTVQIGPHGFLADEPRSLGGDDSGPTPYDLVLAGLGACTSMTLRMYANHKGWPLEGVSVAMTHRKVHARDCEECETKTGKLDDIDRTIRLEGELDDEQRERLLQIADRCPVHRTLHSEVRVRSRLADDAKN